MRLVLWGVLFLTHAQVAYAGELKGFPVKLTGTSTSPAVLVADLNADGITEIIALVGESLVVVDNAGVPKPGFPVSLKDATEAGKLEKMKLELQVAPLACDLDGDGKLEVVVSAGNKKIFAFNDAGVAVRGFPVLLDGIPRGASACVSNFSGKKGAVFAVSDLGNVTRIELGAAPAVVAKIGKGAEAGVAVGDLDNDGAPELVTVGGDARLYVMDLRGKVRERIDYKMSFRSSGTPSLGDIDDDGRVDIVLGSQDFKLHAVSGEGVALAGFPVESEYRIYGGVALADLNGDGVLDAAFGSGDSKLYAVTGQGKLLPGFPVKLDGRVVSDVVVADVDKDGKPELAAMSQSGSLYVVSAAGKNLSGYPAQIGGKGETAPAFVDLNQDGLPELVALSGDGLHAYTFKARGKAEKALVPWPMAGHDAQHTGKIGPIEGRFVELGYVNDKPTTSEPVAVKYRFFDTDGDKELETQIRWYVGNKHVPELDNQREVPAARNKKHEKWRYTLQEGTNFKAYGEKGLLSRIFSAPEVEVINTPAGKPGIELTPATPSTREPLVVTVKVPSVDADEDKVQYRIVWLNNGKPQKNTSDRVDPKDTKKGEEWRVVVVPFDGEVEGESATATVTIKNTVPQAAKIALQPTAPLIDDVVQVKITTPAPDDDNDVATYSYRYWVNGVALALPVMQSQVPARLLHKAETLRVEVTAHDDEAAGASVILELVVKNTAPLAPEVAIYPEKPRTRDALTLGLTKLAPDADGDFVVLQHQWFLNNAMVDHPTTVPEGATSKGQEWRLEVTPFDGELAGPKVLVSTKILNTPPEPPLVVLDKYSFDTDEEIAPKITTPAHDDDGEPVKLNYTWKVDGKPASFAPDKTKLVAADTTKGQTWELTITPQDSETTGKPARLVFSIANAEPTAPAIALSNLAPTTRDTVAVQIVTPATDKDGDTVRYHYEWLKNDVAQEKWPNSKNELNPGDAKKGEVWRVIVRAFDGTTHGPAVSASVRIGNHAPESPLVSVEPQKPQTTDPLTCKVTKVAQDVDGDALVLRTRWFVDDKPVPLYAGQASVPASLTRKKQSWHCEVEAFDGALTSVVTKASPVVIVDAAPTAPVLSLAPKQPKTDDDLVCELATPAADDDLDVISYKFAWKVDGKAYQGPGGDLARIDKEVTKRGQVWECAATPSDGELSGPSASAKVTIGNSTPSIAKAEVRPIKPKALAPLRCEVVQAATDADGETVRYRYAWFKDGVRQGFAATSEEVPARLVQQGDLWRCAVIATDGTDSAAEVESPDVAIEAAASQDVAKK